MLTLFSCFVRVSCWFPYVKRFFTVNSTAPLLHKKGTEKEKIDSLSNLSVSLSVSFSLVFLSVYLYVTGLALPLFHCCVFFFLRPWGYGFYSGVYFSLLLAVFTCVYGHVQSLSVLCCHLCMGACDAGDKGTDSWYTPGEVDAPCQVAVTSLWVLIVVSFVLRSPPVLYVGARWALYYEK
jgi:hypothetical protein